MDPSVLDAISDVGLGALLIGVLIGGYRKWWVFGWLHEAIVADLRADRDFWRGLALRGANIVDKAVDAVPDLNDRG